MHIAIFTDTYLPKVDGISISVQGFTELLVKRGHSFVICAPRYDESESKTHENISVLRFPSGPLPSYPDVRIVLPSRNKIKRAMSLPEPDIIHIQTPGLMGQYGISAARRYKVPVVSTYHTLVSEQETYLSFYRLLKLDYLTELVRKGKKVKKHIPKIERKSEKSLKKRAILKLCNAFYEKSNLIIAPSNQIKEELLHYGLCSPIEVVSNGIDLKIFHAKVKEPFSKSPRLLHLGRISYEKNCNVILESFAIIQKKMPEAKLSIVGEGPALFSLKNEALRMRLQDKVAFHGFLPHAELREIYEQHDLFLTASTMETQGLVVLEAMACGLACVGVDAYALPELIQHERNGFIVEPFAPQKMAEQALKIINNKMLYQGFSEQSIEIAKEHDIHSCAEKLEAIYKKWEKRPGLKKTIPQATPLEKQ